MQIATVKLGTLNVELLESTSEQGVLAKFLKKRGPGVHHIAYAVTDIKKSLQELSRAGLRLIDTEPRIGSDNALIAFAHPKDTGGVLVELCQKQEA
jgi:methylmalonyl-CoA/ethylmalonyl-CoA epimerase